MRTRARLIATIAVCYWLSLASGNHLAANQGSYKPTEEDIRFKNELDRLEKQMKEGEKVLEKYRKQDEDQAKRIAQENEARSTRKMWGRLISGGLFVLVTLVFQMFKKRGRNATNRSSRSSQDESDSESGPRAWPNAPDQSSLASQGDSSPRHTEDASPPIEQPVGAGQKTKHTPKHRKSLVYRLEFNSGKNISIVVDRTSNVIHFENCYSRSRYFRFSPEQHFVCPVSDVTSYHTHYVKNKGAYLVLKTRTGTAQVRASGDNFSDFYDALPQAFPLKQRSFHESSGLAQWLFLLVAFVAFAIGHSLIPKLASNAVHFSIIVPLVVVSVVSVYLWIDSLGRK